MISVVIPAFNEAKTIEHCLATILGHAAPGELEVIVVCNGCIDDTARRARGFGGAVQVIETPVANKSRALNIGDRAARGFPRFYVDADIGLTTAAIRDVAGMLEDSDTIVAAPRAVVDFMGRRRLVRSFYRVWTSLPYFTEGVIGAGVYALSREGRARFDEFPDIIADDQFARLIAKPHERRTSKRSTFTITPPTTLRGVVDIKTRSRAGLYEFRHKFPELCANETTSPARSLRTIARSRRLWPHAAVYLVVMFLAKLRAHRKLRRGRRSRWERDETSRAAVAKSRSPDIEQARDANPPMTDEVAQLHSGWQRLRRTLDRFETLTRHLPAGDRGVAAVSDRCQTLDAVLQRHAVARDHLVQRLRGTNRDAAEKIARLCRTQRFLSSQITMTSERFRDQKLATRIRPLLQLLGDQIAQESREVCCAAGLRRRPRSPSRQTLRATQARAPHVKHGGRNAPSSVSRRQR